MVGIKSNFNSLKSLKQSFFFKSFLVLKKIYYLNYIKKPNTFYYKKSIFKNKLSRVIKKKNSFFFFKNYAFKQSSNIYLKVLNTNRNLFISVYDEKNRLKFILSMGLIKNQNNLKRNSFFASKMLVNALLLKNLFNKELFEDKFGYIIVFLGAGKLYKELYRVFKTHKLNLKGLIQKNNFPHNGCFKKKSKRR